MNEKLKQLETLISLIYQISQQGYSFKPKEEILKIINSGNEFVFGDLLNKESHSNKLILGGDFEVLQKVGSPLILKNNLK